MSSLRKPLPHAEQIERMKRYLRRLRTELRHRHDEFFASTRDRRDCPFEVSLKSRQLDATREAVALAEACLTELRRQEAMFYAPFKPGDRVVVEYADKGTLQTHGPYLVTDVEPWKKTGYCYRVVELTRAGTIHKRRWPHPLLPTDRINIRRSEQKANDEGEREATYYRECAKFSRELSFQHGQLDLFEPVKGMFGSVETYRRRDRMPG
jgi:hypothetical protein